MEISAWAQANLMNVHIPKGKPRMTVDKLLPRGKRKRDRKEIDEEALLDVQQALADNPAEAAKSRLEAKMEKIRASKAENEDAAFWDSVEGHKLREMLEEV